jgi:hypothetical protein
VICAITGELGNLIRQPSILMPLCLHQSQKVETGTKMAVTKLQTSKHQDTSAYVTHTVKADV